MDLFRSYDIASLIMQVTVAISMLVFGRVRARERERKREMESVTT